MKINKTKLPYYVVIFISKPKNNILRYEEVAQEMYDLTMS